MSSIFFKSSAMVKRVGAVNEAATVWPTSMVRASTMPSTGEMMVAFCMSRSKDFTSASAPATAAWVLSKSACARATVAREVSMVAREGVLPPLMSRSSSCRASDALLSVRVAWA